MSEDIPVTEDVIARCPECDTQTQLSTYQTEFCPSCRWVRGGGFVAEVVRCCNVCRTPLALMQPSGRMHCVRCATPKERADTFFRIRT